MSPRDSALIDGTYRIWLDHGNGMLITKLAKCDMEWWALVIRSLEEWPGGFYLLSFLHLISLTLLPASIAWIISPLHGTPQCYSVGVGILSEQWEKQKYDKLLSLSCSLTYSNLQDFSCFTSSEILSSLKILGKTIKHLMWNIYNHNLYQIYSQIYYNSGWLVAYTSLQIFYNFNIVCFHILFF